MKRAEAVAAIELLLEGHPGLDADGNVNRQSFIDWGCVAHNEGQTCCVDEHREALLALMTEQR